MFIGEVVICSQCQKKYQKDKSFKNRKTGEIWCMNCLAIEKKERNKMKYKRTLNGNRDYKRRKYSKKD